MYSVSVNLLRFYSTKIFREFPLKKMMDLVILIFDQNRENAPNAYFESKYLLKCNYLALDNNL